MEALIKNLFGGDNKPAAAPASSNDGFADFAGAPDPSPVPVSVGQSGNTLFGKAAPTLSPQVPYTKWYRVWERTQPSDFIQEAIMIPIFIVILLVHFWGRRANKAKAHDWARHHIPALEFEFAQVGTSRKRESGSDPTSAIEENSASEWGSYATGRQNVAFVDSKIVLTKRFNPLIMIGEQLLSLALDSMPATIEHAEFTAYAFDNKEPDYVARRVDDPPLKPGNSSYDGFVWAVLNKRMLKRLREDRYDLSLTATKDHSKLPVWTTVLTENAEITDLMLTPELIKAIEDAGDLFDALIVSDQPLTRPEKLQETVPKKRFSLILRLPSNSKDYVTTMPIFAYYLRLGDFLVSKARFRPEVSKKLKQARESEINRIKKADEELKAEERKAQADKDKKEKRDTLLRGMSADQQKKYLEKEREKEMRKSQKKQTMRA